MTQKLVLSVTVTHRKSEKPGKVRVITVATVKVGDEIAACVQTAGKASPEQILTLFRQYVRNPGSQPKGITRHPAYDTAALLVDAGVPALILS